MAGISVDPVASLDELKERGYEPSMDCGACNESGESARHDTAEIMRTLYEISAVKPMACLVLLDSAIGRRSERETARRLRVSFRYVRMMRRWLRKEHPALADCLHK
jgi:hypothetical protein